MTSSSHHTRQVIGSKNGRVIAFAGGGTGGHVLPIRSLIQYLDSHDTYRQQIDHVYWIGEADSMESQTASSLFPAITHFPCQFVPLVSGKYRRETIWISRWRNVRDLFRFVYGIFQSLRRLSRHHVDVVFCKGGYAALPFVIAAWIWRKRIIVHESDLSPGITNKVASRCAQTVFTAFPHVLPRAHTIGQILSDEQFQIDLSTVSRSDQTICVVSGGSLGAQKIYDALLALMTKKPELTQMVTFHIILGHKNAHRRQDFLSFPQVTCYDFVDQVTMGKLLAQADICITRGGTTSLAEMTYRGCRLIIIPLPITHDQELNARRYQSHHQARIVHQSLPEYHDTLLDTIISLSSYKKQTITTPPLVHIQSIKKTIVQSLL